MLSKTPIIEISLKPTFLTGKMDKSDSISGKVTTESELNHFQISWKDITYKVVRKGWDLKSTKKTILNKVSGSFKSGIITAILGPSGAGKSTLLDCISGVKKTGLSGAITISTNKEVKFAFISQEDHLFPDLTVFESLCYASRIKNESTSDHKSIAYNILEKINIKDCANNYPKRCSGGQRKRISIALELVSRPNILILDEPTSGLDSATTWQLTNMLIDLTKESEPLAIVATIHQPSARLFSLFGSVYVMSYDGQCIYQGSPSSLVDYLSGLGMLCPDYYNPADFVLEIANKEMGIEKVLMLSNIRSFEAKDIEVFNHKINHEINSRLMNNIIVLTERSLLMTRRNFFLLPFRILGYSITALLMGYMYGSESGLLSGCPPDYFRNKTHYFENFIEVYTALEQNGKGLALASMVATFGSLFPNVLVFPQEINILFKEYGNGWYSLFAYFMSKVLSDLPFQLILPNLTSIPFYLLTHQYINPVSRLYMFAFIFVLASLNASAEGLLVSAVFVNYPAVAATLGITIIMPMVVMSGVMIRIDRMDRVMQALTYTDFMRFSNEAFVVTIYGFNRCDEYPKPNTSITDITATIPVEKMLQIMGSEKLDYNSLLDMIKFVTDTEALFGSESSVLYYFGLVDSDLYKGLLVLIFSIFFYRVLTYFVILRKVNSRN